MASSPPAARQSLRNSPAPKSTVGCSSDLYSPVGSGAHDLGLAVFLQQRKQAFAHQNAGTVRRHVHLDLAGDVDRRVRVGRFQNVAVLLDDGGVPVDQFLGRAVLLAIVAEKDLNELDTAVIDRSGRIEDDV